MIWFPFKRAAKSFLGIDIGTSFIRVVELGRKGQGLKLENYGEVKNSSFPKTPFRVFEKNTLLLSDKEIARLIKLILKTTGIQTKIVNFSLPDFSSFFTNFELPPMSQKELAQAVKYEARSHIPLPLSEVVLDWLVIDGEVSDKPKTPLKILVVAIPNEVINQYQKIASFSQFQIKDLEAEVFALSRFLLKTEQKITGIVDIGARSSTCSILEKGILKTSHSFNISGNELTEVLSRSMGISYEKAEVLKKTEGLVEVEGREKNVREILQPLVDLILAEIKRIFDNFYQQENKRVEKIVLAGGTALMPGLKEYFSEELKKEVVIADPFSNITFPPILDETLKEMGPTYAIAVGLAMKGLE